MFELLRMLSRHWDGKRLLQFLTALALLALTFGGPAAAPATAATPAAATSTTATIAAVRASAATFTGTAATTAAVRASAADTTAATSASLATVPRGTECRHDASGFQRTAPATHPVAPAGVAPGAHGSRAPPRA